MKEKLENVEPIMELLNEIKFKVDNIKQPKKYYRNSDLKTLFGLADNTIIKYRDENILPFAKMGEIYYYPIVGIEEIFKLHNNFDLFGNRY